MMTGPLTWAIVGTGAIAADFVRALEHTPHSSVRGVVGTHPDKSAEFARALGLTRPYRDLAQLLNDPAVDAVYVATPHTEHELVTCRALEAGKHVLCEKPLATSAAAALRMIDAARRADRLLLEGYMYRFHPQIAALLDHLREGELGQLRYVQANFGFHAQRDGAHRLFDPRRAGGAIWDVGGYTTSLLGLIAGLEQGCSYASPTRLVGGARVGPTGVDELATLELAYSTGLRARLSCSIFDELGAELVIFGELGTIAVRNPWLPGGERQGLTASLVVRKYGEPARDTEHSADRPVYALQADYFRTRLAAKQPALPALSWEDSVQNLRILEQWHSSSGVHLPGEFSQAAADT